MPHEAQCRCGPGRRHTAVIVFTLWLRSPKGGGNDMHHRQQTTVTKLCTQAVLLLLTGYAVYYSCLNICVRAGSRQHSVDMNRQCCCC
jgi:hypothetical protein